MLTSLVRGRIIKKISDLPPALTDMISQKRDLTSSVFGDLGKAISYGKRISSVLENLPEKIFKKKWSEEVINQVIDESFING